MLTLQTLARIPEFAPVREAIKTRIATAGVASLLNQLARGEITGDDALVKWLIAESGETFEHRLNAVYLVIEDIVATES